MNPKSTANVLSEWKVSRDHFADAAQTFRRACASLLHTIETSSATIISLNHGPIEDHIMEIRDQMDAILAIEKQMLESKALLRRVINKSTTLVPITSPRRLDSLTLVAN
ncbi:hypothetical protein FRC07_002008 [Ceratobasidium sp. 392]|nr:hypothetical protein FRC07_002008 [Ceratobasidium sp. 392]